MSVSVNYDLVERLGARIIVLLAEASTAEKILVLSGSLSSLVCTMCSDDKRMSTWNELDKMIRDVIERSPSHAEVAETLKKEMM